METGCLETGCRVKILIVEDEAILALDLAQIVEEIGHSVVGPARDVASGLALVESEDLEFALLDLNLGAEFSTPIADRLTQRGVPFCFLSGYSRSHFPPQFASVPAIAKPCTPSDVEKAIAAAAKNPA